MPGVVVGYLAMIERFNELKDAIASRSTFALVCHRRPDGDAIGSLLAFARYLAAQGKEARCYSIDGVPPSLQFLPDIDKVGKELDAFWQSAEMIVVLDCGDISMIGFGDEAVAGRMVCSIDHHVSNPGYGDLPIIDPRAAATGEILWRYFAHVGYVPDRAAATELLTAIYTDTDAFSNLGTTPASLESAGELLALGANFKEITARTLHNRSIASLKLWGRALARLRYDAGKQIAVTVITKDDLAECQATAEDTEGVANLLNHLADVKMAMVLRELDDGTIKGSLRTTHELIDVSKIAKLLGGGGHMKAAGFTIQGKIVETENGWKIIK